MSPLCHTFAVQTVAANLNGVHRMRPSAHGDIDMKFATIEFWVEADPACSPFRTEDERRLFSVIRLKNDDIEDDTKAAPSLDEAQLIALAVHEMLRHDKGALEKFIERGRKIVEDAYPVAPMHAYKLPSV